MIRRFRNLTEFRAAGLAAGLFTATDNRRSRSWYGNETPTQTAELTLTGNRTLVPAAEALMNQLDAKIEIPRKRFQRNAAGPICIVPDILSGSPTPFRRLHHEPDERAPITILSVVTSSGGIGANVLIKRGTAILALVMALAQVRPITLSAVNILHGADASGETVFSVALPTAPLDLARACYALTSQGFCRYLGYELARKLNRFNGDWPKRYSYGAKKQEYYDYLAKVLAPDPLNTLVIGAAELHDPIINAPLEWINAQIRHFTGSQAEAA
jgi:hypothetical protein